MKKSLLALAAMGAFTGAAQAQSSVTVTGALEAGYTNKSVRAINSTTTDTKQAAITAGHVITPNITFRGTEDLGGGLSASFFIQEEFETSTGSTETTNSALKLSQTFVSLSSKQLGTINVGNFYPATRDLGGAYRFMGDIGRLNANMNSNLASNAVEYVSPSFQGFSVNIGNSSLGKTVLSGADTNTAPVSQLTYGLSGTIGKAKVAVSFEDISLVAASAGANQAKNKLMSFGASYDFGVVRLGAAYVDQKVTLPSEADGGKRNAYTINAAAPVSKALTVGASYANYEVTPTTAGAAKPKAVIMTVGAQYAFSKRTSIYASYQQVTNSGADDALKAVSATGVNAGAAGSSRGLGVVEINGGTSSGFGLTAVHTF
jgi:predicted porin